MQTRSVPPSGMAPTGRAKLTWAHLKTTIQDYLWLTLSTPMAMWQQVMQTTMQTNTMQRFGMVLTGQTKLIWARSEQTIQAIPLLAP